MDYKKLKSKESRPKYKIELTPIDILMEIVPGITLIYLWYLIITKYSILPEQIPTHFNFAGEADDFGSKSFIFFLPSIATGLYLLLTIINRYPHTFNYLVEITQSNAKKQYLIATRMIRYLKLAIVTIFSYIAYTIIQSALRGTQSMDEWMLPVILSSVFIPIFIAFYFMLKNR